MSAAAADRLHALDAVRGFALMLGVVFHASMSFVPVSIPIFPVGDSSRSVVMGALFFLLHVFRMSAFFLIAGFFARLSFHKRGARGFIVDRLKRIGIPLVVGWPILISIIAAVLAWVAIRKTGKMPQQQPWPDIPGFFPLAHLWFLYVLLWLYAGALAFRGLFVLRDGSGVLRSYVDRIVNRIVHSWFAPLALAMPFLISLWFASPWIQWFGIPPTDMNLIVNPQAFIAFGTAFAFGWLLHRQVDLLRIWERRWPVHMSIAIALSIACLVLVGPRPLLMPAKRDATTMIYAVCYALAIWTWTLAFIGIAMKFWSDHSPVRRYLADASYWIYLIHLPLVIALQAVVAPLAWPWFVKFPLILMVAFPIMLASYEWLVRYSFIGAVLNGRRAVRASQVDSASPLPELPR